MKKFIALIAAGMVLSMSFTSLASEYKENRTANAAEWANALHELNVEAGFDNGFEPVKSQIKDTVSATAVVDDMETVKAEISNQLTNAANILHEVNNGYGFDNEVDAVKSVLQETVSGTDFATGYEALKQLSSEQLAAFANALHQYNVDILNVDNTYVGNAAN